MTDIRYDVCAVGNAIVDVLSPCDDAFLKAQDLAPNSMQLVDAARSAALYDAMAPGVEASGGSAGNTVAGVGSFGGRAAYIGKVADDTLGQVFTHDIRAAGVHFDTPVLKDGAAEGFGTGRCLVNVLADGQRTMATFLGAANQLFADDIDEALIADSAIVYLEGYLFDPAPARAAFERAAAAAKLAATVEIAAVTRGAEGSVILRGDERVVVPAYPVDKVVDTTGAGDQYAAGFLLGLARGRPLAEAGALGSLAAAEVIAHWGPRPMVKLSDLAAEKGLAEALG